MPTYETLEDFWHEVCARLRSAALGCARLRSAALYAADDDGEAVTARGEYAERCSGDTSRAHGYPGERSVSNRTLDTAARCC